MVNILEKLTENDFLILSILAFLVIIVSIILIMIINKKNKKPVIDKYIEKKAKKVNKPVIKMALAADNIEDIEKVIKNKNTNKLQIEEQDMKNQTSIENVLKAMNEDLEKDRYAKIDAYEEEQEKEAVISYQELRNKMIQKEANITSIEDVNTNEYNNTFFDILDTNEPVVEEIKEEVIEPIDYNFDFDFQLPTEEKIEEKTISNIEESYKGTIEPTEFISPIYGKINENQLYSEITKTDRVRDLSQTSDTDEFLNTLKEFRNSL